MQTSTQIGPSTLAMNSCASLVIDTGCGHSPPSASPTEMKGIGPSILLQRGLLRSRESRRCARPAQVLHTASSSLLVSFLKRSCRFMLEHTAYPICCLFFALNTQSSQLSGFFFSFLKKLSFAGGTRKRREVTAVGMQEIQQITQRTIKRKLSWGHGPG